MSGNASQEFRGITTFTREFWHFTREIHTFTREFHVVQK
ncbi:hypothetical protein SRABI134_01020 [Peribacillus sp. Bi134]|nr:hypothetical protein SRABI134_01020 [Peribacillus sp. Bi134]